MTQGGTRDLLGLQYLAKGLPTMRSTFPRLLAIGCLAVCLLVRSPIASAWSTSTRPIFRTPATAPMQGAGEYTSVALDAAGLVHVAWFDAARGALEYAWQAPGGWRSEEIDHAQGGPVGWYASLALDVRGVAHVAYYDAGHGLLKHAERRGGAWTVEVVDAADEGAGHYCSLALTPQGEPAISFYDPHQLSLRYAARTAGAWRIETVDGAGNAAEAGTAVDRPDKDSKTPEVSQDVPNVGLYTSLAIGRDGTPHISYQDVTDADLKVAVRRGGSWQLETVDAQGDVGEHTSLKLDATGRARVSYYDLQRGALKLATEGGDGTWTTQTVDADGDVGAWSSLAVDADGGLHVSYLDVTRGALKYAENLEGGGWLAQVLDAKGGAGHNSALALARDGAPVIAYTTRAPYRSFRVVSASLGSGVDGAPARPGLDGVALSAGPLPYRGGELHVAFSLPSGSGDAEVSLIDVTGRHVRTLRPQARDAGQVSLSWDGRDDGQRAVPDGVYFLVGRAAGRETRLKLVVVR